MRSLILASILCLTSTSAFACMYDSQCEPGNVCLDGNCTRSHSSGDDDDVPVKRSPSKGKTAATMMIATQLLVGLRAQVQRGVCIGHLSCGGLALV